MPVSQVFNVRIKIELKKGFFYPAQDYHLKTLYYRTHTAIRPFSLFFYSEEMLVIDCLITLHVLFSILKVIIL